MESAKVAENENISEIIAFSDAEYDDCLSGVLHDY